MTDYKKLFVFPYPMIMKVWGKKYSNVDNDNSVNYHKYFFNV